MVLLKTCPIRATGVDQLVLNKTVTADTTVQSTLLGASVFTGFPVRALTRLRVSFPSTGSGSYHLIGLGNNTGFSCVLKSLLKARES